MVANFNNIRPRRLHIDNNTSAPLCRDAACRVSHRDTPPGRVKYTNYLISNPLNDNSVPQRVHRNILFYCIIYAFRSIFYKNGCYRAITNQM